MPGFLTRSPAPRASYNSSALFSQMPSVQAREGFEDFGINILAENELLKGNF